MEVRRPNPQPLAHPWSSSTYMHHRRFRTYRDLGARSGVRLVVHNVVSSAAGSRGRGKGDRVLHQLPPKIREGICYWSTVAGWQDYLARRENVAEPSVWKRRTRSMKQSSPCPSPVVLMIALPDRFRFAVCGLTLGTTSRPASQSECRRRATLMHPPASPFSIPSSVHPKIG
jgi:hypothetical protein